MLLRAMLAWSAFCSVWLLQATPFPTLRAGESPPLNAEPSLFADVEPAFVSAADATEQLEPELTSDGVAQAAWLDAAAAPPVDPIVQSLQKRLDDVEKQLKKRDEADKKAADAAAKKFTLRPFGRLHVDAAGFNQDANNIATVGNARNGVDIRRLRLGVEGEGFDTFFYRLDVDFVTFDPAEKTRPTVFDAYLDTQNLPVLGNVRAGHFREPFSLERLDSSHDFPFMERSNPVNALTPSRNIGLMAFNWNDSETLTWAYGVFDENTNEFGEDLHDGTTLAYTGRVTWLPWYDEYAQGRYLLHVGASYSYRNVRGHTKQFKSTPEVQIKQGTMSTPSFVDTGPLFVDDYHVAGTEFCAQLGSLTFQGEYLFVAGTQTSGDSLFLHGGYLEANYWLTGENDNYDRRLGIHRGVTPHSNFFVVNTDRGIEHGSGAWELATRVSNLDLTHGSVNGGNLVDFTAGVNWYYTIRSRVMFNYIHAFLDRKALHSNADIFAMRFQYAF